MPKKPAKPTATKPGYIPTSKERAAIEKAIHRHRTASPTPRLKILNNQVSIDHPERVAGELLMMEAFGASTLDFMYGMLTHMANASSQGNKGNENELNFMVSIVKDIKPRDHIEAMLAAQMAAVHVLSMRFAHGLANSENIFQQDSAERVFNKLTRTFPASDSEGEAMKGNRDARHPGRTHPSKRQSPADGNEGRSDEAQGGLMGSNHPRNTGPMLASQRCGAKTSVGGSCRSPAVRGKKRCRMHGARQDRARRNKIKTLSSTACSRRPRSQSGNAFRL